jgi:hypothetical protein
MPKGQLLSAHKRFKNPIRNSKLRPEPLEKNNGEVTSYFKIKVKGDDGSILYENTQEPFTHKVCRNILEVLSDAGEVLTAEEAKLLGEALKNHTKGQERIVKVYNATLKSNAKATRYQQLILVYKEQRDEILRKILESYPNLSKEEVIRFLESKSEK